MTICFCLNNLGAFGLGATLTSLLKNCSAASRLDLYFLCSAVDVQIKKAIVHLLAANDFKGNHCFIDFNPDIIFKNYRSLQGDRTTYGRLLIADLIQKDEVVLYLDSDLVIETDILQLEATDLGNYAIGGVAGSDVQYNLEHHFYLKILQLPADTVSFNAGVLMINVPVWKQQELKNKLLVFADQYPNELLAADQTLLNGFFAGDFYFLPAEFNSAWHADYPSELQNAIYHFVGSPKPWDLFGKQLHAGYEKWKRYSSEEWHRNVLSRHSVEQWKRWWHIRRSYSKLLLNKWRK